MKHLKKNLLRSALQASPFNRWLRFTICSPRSARVDRSNCVSKAVNSFARPCSKEASRKKKNAVAASHEQSARWRLRRRLPRATSPEVRLRPLLKAVAPWTWGVSTGNLDLHLPPTQDFHERVVVLALTEEGLVENCCELPLREEPQHLHERLGLGFLVFLSFEHLDKQATARPLLDVVSGAVDPLKRRAIATTLEGQTSTDRRPIMILEKRPSHDLQADSYTVRGHRASAHCISTWSFMRSRHVGSMADKKEVNNIIFSIDWRRTDTAFWPRLIML